MDEHFGRLKDLRAQRLPEVKGFIVTADAPGSAGLRLTQIGKMVGISLLDPEQDEIARGLTPVMAKLGPADLATLDALVTAGIAASRAETARWAMARIVDGAAGIVVCAGTAARLTADFSVTAGTTAAGRPSTPRTAGRIPAVGAGRHPAQQARSSSRPR
jgi:hypothetical protein